MGDYVWFHDVSWHASYAVYFFVIGILAGLSFISYGSWRTPALRPLREKTAYASFVLLGLGGMLLIADLSQPLRFLNILNPAYLNFKSPLAWGALNIVAFSIASIFYILALRKGDEKNGQLLALITALLALGLPIYTGFDLTVHQSRPVWNTPIMPVLFVALAIASGSAVGALLAAGNAEAQKVLREYMLWSAGAVAVMLVSIMGTTNYGGSAAELTFMIMTTGTMGLLFIGVGFLGGSVAPALMLFAPMGKSQPVHKSLGESRENRVLLRDIIHKLDPEGKRGMKQFWEFKDGEDYMRHHFDNVPGLKEAGGLDFLKKHGVWPIYGKLDPKTGKVSDKTGREIKAEYGLYKKEISAADMAGATVDSKGIISKNGKAIGVRRDGKNYVGFPTGNRLINVRIDQWAEYGFNPMPTFKRIPWHETMKEDELILSTFKLNVHKQSRTAAVKWLAEIAHSNPAWMNPETAAKLGVKTGDLVRVESAVGHLVTKAYVTEGIHPKVVSIPTGFGHWEYGRLATLRLKDKKGEASHGQDDPDLNNVWWDDKGVHPNNIIPVVADPIGGSQGWYDTVVKVTKAGPNDKYGDSEGNWEKHVAAYKETMRYAYTGDLHRKMHPEMASWAGPDSVKHKAGGGH